MSSPISKLAVYRITLIDQDKQGKKKGFQLTQKAATM